MIEKRRRLVKKNNKGSSFLYGEMYIQNDKWSYPKTWNSSIY